MSAQPTSGSGGRSRDLAGAAALSAGAALVLRLTAIVLWPPVYGGDALGRLEHAGEPVWSPVQLPAASVLVWLVHALHPDPLAQRVAFAILGSFACGAGALAAGLAAGRRAGLLAGLVLAVCPVLVEWTVVPYQEGPFLLLLLPGLALAHLAKGPEGVAAAALLLGAATTVRYEGWYVLPVLLVLPPRPRTRLALLLPAVAAFPAAWVLRHGALTPSGTRSLQPGLSLDRLLDPLICLGGTAKLLTPPLFLAGIAGLVMRRHGQEQLPDAARRFLGSLAALLAISLGVLAVARPYEPPRNPRQTILPAAILGILAGVALDHLERSLPRLLYPYPRPRRRWVLAAALLIFAGPALYGLARCRRQSLSDDARMGWRLGRDLGMRLAERELALVEMPPRSDYPELEPTLVRFARVAAGDAGSRILYADPSRSPERIAEIRYLASIPGAGRDLRADPRARAILGPDPRRLEPPDPGIVLLERSP